VYNRSSKNIILGTNAKDIMRRIQQRKREKESNDAMEINDFGLMNSQERKKSEDSDP